MSKNSCLFIKFIKNWIEHTYLGNDKLGKLFVNNNDCLCYENIAKFPFARLDREKKTIVIHFHTRYKKFIGALLENEKEFAGLLDNWVFVHTLYPEKNNHDPYDNHFDNMYNIIETYLIEPFFSILKNGKFDLVDLLENYILYNDCLEIFDDICYYRLNGLLSRKTYCHLTGNRIDVFNDEMKAKLIGLDRKIRINSILRNLD